MSAVVRWSPAPPGRLGEGALTRKSKEAADHE